MLRSIFCLQGVHKMASIAKQSTKFRYGFSNLNQLETWLNENKKIKALAFIGRSNVGKSSIINALFGKKTARTSKTPGRTREINVFSFNLTASEETYYFFDLPGYGHAEVSKEMSQHWNKLMNVFFNRVSAHTLMINIQDARHPMQKSDQQFIDYLQNFTYPTLYLLNKFDKLKKQKERAKLDKEIKVIIAQKQIKKFMKVSAETKLGIPELEEKIVAFLQDEITS